MQVSSVSKVFGAGVVALVAMFALWGALFAVQPAYADDAQLAAGATDLVGGAQLSTQVQAPTQAKVRVGESLTVKGIKNAADNQGECTWTCKSSNKAVATAKISGTSTTPKLVVKGVSAGSATVTVTCKNSSGLTNSAKVKVLVQGIKDMVQVDGFLYQRNSVNSVTFKGAVTKKAKKAATIKVPATINVSDVKGDQYKAKYKVTKLAFGALSNKIYAKSIIIGNNVQKIGGHAFCYDSKLTKLVIGKNVTKLGKKMVHIKDKKLKTIIIKSTKLTKAGVKDCLKGNKYVKTVKVPASKYKQYKKFFTKANCGKKVTVKKL